MTDPKTTSGSTFNAFSHGGEGGFRSERSIESVWQQLVFAQVSLIRDFWGLAAKPLADPARWTDRLTQFWSRWSSPTSWCAGGPESPPLQPPSFYFAIDDKAEASSEQEMPISGAVAPGERLIASPLKNVLSRGEVAAAHVEASCLERNGYRYLRVALVNLGAIRREGRPEPGLYVGALSADRAPQAPLASVQMLVP